MSNIRTNEQLKEQLLEIIENRVKEFTGWVWVNARVKKDCLVIKQQDLYSHSTVELKFNIREDKEIKGSIKRIGLNKELLEELKCVHCCDEDMNEKPKHNFVPVGHFVSAKKIASSLAFAKIYLLSREKDYKEFCSQLSFHNQDDFLQPQEDNFITIFPNGKRAVFYIDGKVALFNGTYGKPISFDSFEQFAAYYLASHG